MVAGEQLGGQDIEAPNPKAQDEFDAVEINDQGPLPAPPDPGIMPAAIRE